MPRGFQHKQPLLERQDLDMPSRRSLLKAGVATSGGVLAAILLARGGLYAGNDVDDALESGNNRAPPQGPQLEFVNVADFNAIGDGDSANAEANTEAIQTALNTGKNVFLGDASAVFALAAPLKMHSQQRLYAEGATLLASRRMSQIVMAADGVTIEGVAFDCNNTQPENGIPIEASGAVYGISIRDVSNCILRRCSFTRYKRGVSITSSARGIKCGDHLVEDCEAIAGFTWPNWRSGNEQHGAYVGSEAQGDVKSIAEYGNAEREANDVSDIRFVNWRAQEGQYGLALHRCSRISVLGGEFRQMSRAISIQHQSNNVTVSGVLVENTDSAGIHMAQGAHKISVVGNRISGTMSNDNAGVQGYYGVREVVVANNILDSKFDSWDGGGAESLRAPGAAIRFGQQAQGITIRDNVIRGFRWGVLLKSTIYEDAIKRSDLNYYFTGVRNIRVSRNLISGDYFSGRSGFKQPMRKSETFGVVVAQSAPWEDISRGGWNIGDITISENTVSNTGTAYAASKVVSRKWGVEAGFDDEAIRLQDNEAFDADRDYEALGPINRRAVTSSGNSWANEN